MDCFEHFVREGTEIYVGKHLIIDLWGIVNHSDGDRIKRMFIASCIDAGATVLFSHQHEFGENCGTTGVVVLSESHASWHHYPEVKMISIDIFMCGKADPNKALPRIIEFWKPIHTDISLIKRGSVEKGKLPVDLTYIMN